MAAAALLMAAYSIAASPETAAADSGAVHLASLGTVLSDVPHSMGFSTQRRQNLVSVEGDDEIFVVAAGTVWVLLLAVLCVTGAMLGRRFGSR
jgi:hypothetical protein